MLILLSDHLNMKWYQQILIGVYILPGLYFLYIGILNAYVYFANKQLGHDESFLPAGRNLTYAVILIGSGLFSWYVFQNPNSSRFFYILAYLPFALVALFFFYMMLVLISSGGKWN